MRESFATHCASRLSNVNSRSMQDPALNNEFYRISLYRRHTMRGNMSVLSPSRDNLDWDS